MLKVAGSEWMRAGYQFNLYGQKGWRSVLPNLKDLYSYLLEAFVTFLTTGKEIVSLEKEVELIAALEAGKLSLEFGPEVDPAEVMPG